MSLTNRQKRIYEKISSVDSSWTEEGFIKCWNDILKLAKFISVTDGKIVLEFEDASYATVKFKKNNQILLEEKIYWNEYIKTEEDNKNEVVKLAQNIRLLAERIITS